jgi:small subunit ribosomal protein S4e
MGRSGVIVHRERHLGGFGELGVRFEVARGMDELTYYFPPTDIVHVRDVLDREFATRIGNVFVTGQGNKAWVS